MRRDKTNYVIQSVSHALDVLEQFTDDTDELGVTELSKRLKLHKNNVFRLLATLEARGYIEQNRATENYRLGLRCLRLGQGYVTQTGLLRQARPVLLKVADASRETAFVAIMSNGTIVPLDAVEAARPVRLVARIGDALPSHCTAAGKLYLAFADEALRNSLPETLKQYTHETVATRHALIDQLRVVADRGYAIDRGEHIDDVCSVAVPVRDYTRTIVAALAVSGPTYRLPQERLDAEIVPLMLKAGRDLSTRLGFDSDQATAGKT